MREPPNRLSAEVFDTPPTFAHETRNTAAFDFTKEYCTPDIVLSWQPPSSFSPWTPARFTVECVSYSCGEQYFAAEKSRLFGNIRRSNTSWACPTSATQSSMVKKYVTLRNFDLAVWQRERETIVLVSSYAKFAKT